MTGVLAAAKNGVEAVTRYDYRHLQTDLAAGLQVCTDPFRGQYSSAMTGNVLKLAPPTRTIASATFHDLGAAGASTDGATYVIYAVGQHAVTNSTTSPGSPRLDLIDLTVTLRRVGQRWLISRLVSGGT